MSDSDHVRWTVHFSGHVQGVGFRFNARQIAQGLDVTGFVQNLPDGRVLLEAEGTDPEISALIEAITQRMQQFLQDWTIDKSPAIGGHQSFEIRH